MRKYIENDMKKLNTNNLITLIIGEKVELLTYHISVGHLLIHYVWLWHDYKYNTAENEGNHQIFVDSNTAALQRSA